MKTRRFLILVFLTALVAFIVLPEVMHSLWHYRMHRHYVEEQEKITTLVQAGNSGYDELVRLLPTLRFGNVNEALKGILAQENRDRVADLCSAYAASGNNHNTKTAIAGALGKLGDTRAIPILVKDLDSVWSDLTLIQYDTQIEVLGELKAKEAADLFVRILRHKYSWEGSSWQIKENIFVALGKIGDERVLPDASQQAVNQTDWYVRQGALNYLTRINNAEAKAALWKAYNVQKEPEVALCLVQAGEKSVLPDIRICLRKWLDNFDAGGWTKTDYWGVFYCVQALLIAKDRDALPELRRALTLFKSDNPETQRYVAEAPRGYTSKLMLNEQMAETLVSDLERFLDQTAR
jgi:hypothetical protein